MGIKYHADHQNRDLIEHVSSAFNAHGHAVFCVARDLERWGEVAFSPQDLMTKTFEAIASCDLVLIELSEKGVGLGIEAGYAHAIGKRIVTIAKAGSDISETLAGISSAVFWYDTEADLERVARDLSG